ncbi:MAG: hypothetical protein WB820_13040 [Rhodoplanes sp.]
MRKLSPDQADAVRAANPLPTADRDLFFNDVIEALAGLGDLGDGIVHQVCRDVQHKYWGSPNLNHVSSRGR